jgi:organic radical activating enzyme
MTELKPRDWLLVSETFKTVQGEGPSSGVPAFFIRLGGCNLHCKWCDSGYTWVFDDRHVAMHDKSLAPFDPRTELKRMSLYEATDQIFKSECRLVVITGGEPLLQLEPVAKLISACNDYPQRRFAFEIETAGTLDPGELLAFENVTFNVSPKLKHSGNELELRRTPALGILQSAPRAVFKFVVEDGETATQLSQLEEIETILKGYGIPDYRVWLMPVGTTTAEIEHGLQVWTPWAVSRGWNITSRLQILAFGDTRGT